ncbi:glycosyltransferase [Polaromonas sp. CT11-55]|uniref:glycosyltransferase n=1 Tax=Polaromonas sp. CT11-55 TaxID=3243045 RepID=UPI0039A560BC
MKSHTAGNAMSRAGTEAVPLQQDVCSASLGLVCAVVVAYYPDEEFITRLRGLSPQVARLVIVDNTPAECAVRQLELPEDAANIHLVSNRANLGISAALNQGLHHALDAGCKWALTLDQDTQCFADMVSTLLGVSQACSPAPAVIGGNYLDPRSKHPKVAIGEAASFLVQKTVITSGSLVDVRLALAMGGFREDYFIDQVDHEFCLRARAHGHQVIISRKPVMTHSVGESGGVRLPLLGILPNHPPVRKYYIARNTVVTVMTYWRREPEWCLRRLARLLLGLGGMAFLEKQGFAKVRAFAGGIVDGLRGRMGPCARESVLRPRSGIS